MGSFYKAIVLSTLLTCVVSQGSLRCGGLLKEAQGTVSHKVGESITSNERCVWIVRAPDATSYNVTLLGQGLSGTVIINGLGLFNLTTYSVPSEVGATVTIPNSNVLVITFYTEIINGNDKPTGFALNYVAHTNGINQKATGISSTDVIANGDFESFEHPPEYAGKYDNFDLSVSIFAPVNNIFSDGGRVDVLYHELGLAAPVGSDGLHIYGFDVSSSQTHKWDYLGFITRENSTVAIRRNDLTMIVFESDEVDVNYGYYLSSSTTSCAQ